MFADFKPVQFSGFAISIAAFLFQVIPAAMMLLAPDDIEYRLSLVLGLYLPAAIVMIVLQGRFLSNAIHNLHRFDAEISISPGTGWLSAVPFVNLLVVPWLVYTVHERTLTLAPERHNTSERSGWLTMFWYGTFIVGIVVGALAELRPRPDQQFEQMLLAGLIGIVNAALTKRLTGEITKVQEAEEFDTGLVEVRAKPNQPPSPQPAPQPVRLPETPPKAAPRPVPPQAKPETNPASAAAGKAVVACPSCKGKLSLPAGKFGIVRCPKCETFFETDT